MPSGGSTQVFAFTTLSFTSQLSLASCMTTSALLDFAIASPAFNIFLRTHCSEIVLAALRTQYGYIPDTTNWDTYHLLPLYTVRTPGRRRHKRTSSRETNDLLRDLPMLQRLLDEELLSDHAKKILSLLSTTPQASSIYGPGIRGLLRYSKHYTAFAVTHPDGTARHEAMQCWLQDRYTSWGINEMIFVVDALSCYIDALLPCLHQDNVKREQITGSLLCNLEVLRLSDCGSEMAVLERLEDRGVIQFVPSEWRVVDPSHRYWFNKPAQAALQGEPMVDRRAWARARDTKARSSFSASEEEEEVRLMVRAGIVARNKRARAVGIRWEHRSSRGGVVGGAWMVD